MKCIFHYENRDTQPLEGSTDPKAGNRSMSKDGGGEDIKKKDETGKEMNTMELLDSDVDSSFGAEQSHS